MISVIVPVYNTEKYLNKCIDSLLKQTYKDLQIILINDGSTDNSLSIMKESEKRDSRILVIDQEHDGVSSARNAGIKKASGEYISFIDSDDWIDLETYEIVLDILMRNDADAVYYEWTEEYSDGTSTTRGHRGKEKIIAEGDEILRRYFKNDVNWRISSGILKKTLVDNVFFEVGRELGEDMLFCFFTIAKAERIVYVDLPLYHRYNRMGSLSNQLSFKRSDFGTATCTDAMIEYVQKNKPQLLQGAYVYSFNFYMVVMNYLSYYRCEKENKDIYDAIMKKLPELWKIIDSPFKQLPVTVLGAYIVSLLNKRLYHYIMVIYYRYIKRELSGKRQMNER